MSAHTPGPWVGRSMHDPILIQGCDEVGLSIAFACGGGDPRRGEFMANARLIAAAPEMLRELKDILSWAGTEREPLRQTEIDSIRAVIAKATQP